MKNKITSFRMLISSKAAEGKATAMVAVVPRVDDGAVEVEVAGARTGVGTTRPVGAAGMAAAGHAVIPEEISTPEEGERYIFYQGV